MIVFSDVNLVTSTVSSSFHHLDPSMNFSVGLERNFNDRDHAVSKIALLNFHQPEPVCCDVLSLRMRFLLRPSLDILFFCFVNPHSNIYFFHLFFRENGGEGKIHTERNIDLEESH